MGGERRRLTDVFMDVAYGPRMGKETGYADLEF